MHEAIASVREVVAKYYALLTLGIVGRWEPVPQFDPLEPFTTPWMIDRSAVEEALRRG